MKTLLFTMLTALAATFLLSIVGYLVMFAMVVGG